MNFRSPCRHILLKREPTPGSLSSVFHLSLFHTRYHKGSTVENSSPVLQPEACTPPFLEDDINDCHTTIFPSLSRREKYNLIMPILMNIWTLASCHGTEEFMRYLESMRKVEEAVRTGTSFLNERVDVSLASAFQVASVLVESSSAPASPLHLPQH